MGGFRLEPVDDQVVVIEQDGSEVELEWANIVKGRLVPDYDAILAGTKDKN